MSTVGIFKVNYIENGRNYTVLSKGAVTLLGGGLKHLFCNKILINLLEKTERVGDTHASKVGLSSMKSFHEITLLLLVETEKLTSTPYNRLI